MRIPELVGSQEAARRLGVTQAHFNKLVLAGEVVVAMQAPGRTGARLFEPREIDRLAARRAASKKVAS